MSPLLSRQVSYGVGSSRLSNKIKFPSFLRTVHSNDGMIEVIVKIIVHFNWRWVAFLNSDNDYGRDGLDLFIKKIDGTDICLAYTNALNDNTNYSQIFEQKHKKYMLSLFLLQKRLQKLLLRQQYK